MAYEDIPAKCGRRFYGTSKSYVQRQVAKHESGCKKCKEQE